MAKLSDLSLTSKFDFRSRQVHQSVIENSGSAWANSRICAHFPCANLPRSRKRCGNAL